MHGMGDAAANAGMVNIKNIISARLGGTYAVNAALASTKAGDTMGEFT